MKYIVILIVALAAVDCMPRPAGFGTPGDSVPMGTNGQGSFQPGANVGEDGEVEVKQTQTRYDESHTEDSDSDAYEHEHNDQDGESVRQSSEKNTTHSESEKQKETDTNSVKLGPQSGVKISQDRSSESERKEQNTETGRQSSEKSSGDNPDHQHTYQSESEYSNTNQSTDRHDEQSHDEFSIGPDLQTDSKHDKFTLDQHDEQQTAEGSSRTRQEDYDRNGDNVRHSGSMSQSQYNKEAAKSSSNSTSETEEKSSKKSGDDRRNNEAVLDLEYEGQNGQTSGEVNGETTIEHNIDANINQNTETKGQINRESEVWSDNEASVNRNSQTSGQIYGKNEEQNDNEASVDHKIDTNGQIYSRRDVENDKNFDQNTEINGTISSQKEVKNDNQASVNQNSRIENNINDESKIQNYKEASIHEKEERESNLYAESDDKVSYVNETKSQVAVEDYQGNVEENQASGSAKMSGHKLRPSKNVYRLLDHDRIALGIIRGHDLTSSIESIESHERTDKLRNDYLLSVAQGIRNTKIMSDSKGRAKIVSPLQNSDDYSFADFVNSKTPYRTIAQRYGASPVSSHYANAQFIESRYKNRPLFGSTKYDRLQNIRNTQYGEERTGLGTGTTQHSIRNIFDRASRMKYGRDTANLQLSPMEWEKRAQKEAEIKNAQLDNQRYITRSQVKNVKKINPLLKRAIFSRNVDEILKTGKSSTKSSYDMKTIFGKKSQFLPIPINKLNEITNAEAITSNENEIFGYDKYVVANKPDYSVPITFYGDTTYISQVTTSKVDLASANEMFDVNVVSENIENTSENSGFTHIDDSFDFEQDFVNINLEKPVEGSVDDISNSTVTPEESKPMNTQDFYDSTKTVTDEGFSIKSETTETTVNFNSNYNTMSNYNLSTEYETSSTIVSENNKNQEKDVGSISVVDLSDRNVKTQFLTNTEELSSQQYVNATAQDFTYDDNDLKRNVELGNGNDDFGKNVDITNYIVKLNNETIPEIKEMNDTSSQGVSKEFYSETNKSSNVTEIPDLTTANTKDNDELMESTTDLNEIEIKEVSDNSHNTQESVNLSKRNLEEIGDDYSLSEGSSNFEFGVETKSNLYSEVNSNNTILVNDSLADAYFELMKPTIASYFIETDDIDKTKDISNTPTMFPNVNWNGSNDFEFDTTEIITSLTSKNENQTLIIDKANSTGSTERLFARSLLESEEEYYRDNTKLIPNESNDFDESTVALTTGTYDNASEITTIQNELSVDSQNYDSGIVKSVNKIEISTEVTTSTEFSSFIDDLSETGLNVADNVRDIFNTQNLKPPVTSDNEKDFAVESDSKSENITSNTSDLNTDNAEYNNEKSQYLVKAENKPDELNAASIGTVSTELNIAKETSEAKEGNSDYTSITADNFANTTNVSTVNGTKGNGRMDDSDKIKKLSNNESDKVPEIMNSDKSEFIIEFENLETDNASIKSDQLNTSVKSETIVESDRLMPVRSEKEKGSKSGIDESTSRSDESRSVSDEHWLFVSGLDSITTDSSSTSVEGRR